MVIGGIEAGGTKIVYGIATEEGGRITIEERREIPTRDGRTTIDALISYFKKKEIDSLGLASFGPLELDPASKNYGMVEGTPKKGWDEVPFGGWLQEALSVPIAVETDVNAAVMAEVLYGAAKGCDNALYITVGTGIGMGLWVNGAPVHGILHPEAGHMGVVRMAGDTYEGICPFHRDEKGRSTCLEGLAAGPAMEGRWGKPGKELGANDKAWAWEADYLAQGIHNLILTCAPEKIILGGGVMHHRELFPLIRKQVQEKLGGYIKRKEIETDMDTYIIPPALGDNAGLLGAFALARKAIEQV